MITVTAVPVNPPRAFLPKCRAHGQLSGIVIRQRYLRAAARRRTRSGAARPVAWRECRERPQPESRDSPKTAASIARAWPDERIALSRHRTGARSSRRKRGLIRRFGLVFPVAIFAVIAVVGVAVGGKLVAPGSSAFGAVQAIGVVPGSHTMAALESERTQLIAMTTAARTLTVVAKPKLAQPAEVAAANPGTTRPVAGAATGSSLSRLRRLTPARPSPSRTTCWLASASARPPSSAA